MVHYRKVVEVDASNVTAMNNLAFDICRGGENLDEALRYAQRAKELDPGNPIVQDTLGRIYYRKGLYDMAANELKSALSKDGRPVVKFHLGLIYLKLGNPATGKELIARAVRDDPKIAQTETWQ